MPVMDEFKEERLALKNGTPKQKLAYFWDYYKWPTIIAVIGVIVIVSFIRQIVTHKDTALYALLLNGSAKNYLAGEADYTKAFAEYAGIDEEKYQILYDTSVHVGMGSADEYNSVQKLMVYIAAGELDVMVSDSNSLLKYAYQENFQDLRDFLTEEQQKKYADSFYYIDLAVTREHEAANEANDYDYVPVYGDPRHPEDMEDPVPAGVFLPRDCSLFKDFSFPEGELAAGVMINTKHPEAASKYIDFLMNAESGSSD